VDAVEGTRATIARRPGPAPRVDDAGPSLTSPSSEESSLVYFYRPSEGHGLPHDPFNALVAPRPIGWISTRSTAGVLNLAPYSFFNAFNYKPPIIGFSSNGYKDSVRNVAETREFVWNLATRPIAEAMNATSATVEHHVDEFELGGLTAEPSRVVGVPRVAEAPVAMECRLSQLIQLTGADGTPAQTWLVLGEVVGVHIREDLLEDGVYQTAKARPVVRGGGPTTYFEVTDDTRFDLTRPP
jgi:flavin reductase (DIM6/NTAB) family NADH-FMN oxidoreductase RutF